MAAPMHPPPLFKHKSWSPDSSREEVWQRRKGVHNGRQRARGGWLVGSVTDEDLDELRGCIELGFRFDLDRAASGGGRLSETLPALDLYYAVHRQQAGGAEGLSASDSSQASSAGSSPFSIYSPGDSPQQVKARLKQWAQVVACAVRQRC